MILIDAIKISIFTSISPIRDLMNKCGKLMLALAIGCILINSCKLDKPVLPGEPGYEAATDPTANMQTVTGTTVTGTTVNNSNLSATWKVATTTKQFYDQNNVVVSSSLAFNPFTSVILSEPAKTAGFENLTAAPSAETYSLSNTDGNLYIQLSADPFSRSINSQIQITNLTASSMTWLAIDPKIVSAGGQLLRNAYLVTFTR